VYHDCFFKSAGTASEISLSAFLISVNIPSICSFTFVEEGVDFNVEEEGAGVEELEGVEGGGVEEELEEDELGEGDELTLSTSGFEKAGRGFDSLL